MRVVVTGGAGFIGGVVVRRLRDRDDSVIALVRDPARAEALARIGCEVVASDLSGSDEPAQVMAGADAVVHVAGAYRIGAGAA